MTITFFVTGTPKPQPRPRAFAMGGKVRVYDPATAEGWKSCIAQAAREVLPSEPITEPIKLDVCFFMPRPKSHSKKDGSYRESHIDRRHSQKPDADNLVKAVMDALSELQAWKDDSQVWDLRVVKVWADTARISGAQVSITTFGGV